MIHRTTKQQPRSPLFWQERILVALDTEYFFTMQAHDRTRDPALVHVAVSRFSTTASCISGRLKVDGDPYDHEPTLRGITVHLPVCLLATIPAMWQHTSLGFQKLVWDYERRPNFQNGQATVVGTVQMGSFLQSCPVFLEIYLASMQKRAQFLQEDRLLITSPADHIFSAQAT